MLSSTLKPAQVNSLFVFADSMENSRNLQDQLRHLLKWICMYEVILSYCLNCTVQLKSVLFSRSCTVCPSAYRFLSCVAVCNWHFCLTKGILLLYYFLCFMCHCQFVYLWVILIVFICAVFMCCISFMSVYYWMFDFADVWPMVCLWKVHAGVCLLVCLFLSLSTTRKCFIA